MMSLPVGGQFTVGIIHYRDPPAIKRLLSSMDRWSVKPSTVVIADNSSDLPWDVLQSAPMGIDCKVVDMHENIGYAAAANRIIAGLGESSEYFLLLTQDAELEDNAAECLLGALEMDSQVAVAVPLLLFSSNRDVIFSAGGVITKRGRTLHTGQGDEYDPVHWNGCEPFSVDWGDGACLFINLLAVRALGQFDEEYFLYVEEVDFQFRLRQAGSQVILVPQAVAYQEPGPYSLYYKYRNLPRFTRKFPSSFRPWPWAVAFPKDCLRMLSQRRTSEPLWAVRGLIDGYRGVTGPQPRTLTSRRVSPKPSSTLLRLIVETLPSAAPPGIARRYGHITDWLNRNEVMFETIVLESIDKPQSGKFGRFNRTLAARRNLLRNTNDADRMYFLGLGAVHMLLLAAACSGRGRSVYYDACDSWILQAKARARRRSLSLLAPSIGGILAQAFLARRVGVSYISTRDLLSDRLLNWGRRSAVVIPIAVPPELKEIPPMNGAPVARLVVSADYRAFHNLEIVSALLGAWPTVVASLPDVHLDLYGLGEIGSNLPVATTQRGWAKDLVDIYFGSTVVLITNFGGSGVPNKLAEAISAQRPLVLHVSMRPLLPDHPWLHYFSSRDDLAATISEALSAKYEGNSLPRLELLSDDSVIDDAFFS